MMILALVRNYIPSYGWVIRGGWNIADCVERSYDLEGMAVGTVAAGRIGTGGAAPPQAVRRQAALHRPAPATRRGGARAGPDLPRRRAAAMVPALRCGHHQRAALPRYRGPVQRRADRDHEAGRHTSSTRLAGRSATATPSSGRSRADSWPATPATCGSPSPHRKTTPGGRCPTTA